MCGGSRGGIGDQVKEIVKGWGGEKRLTENNGRTVRHKRAMTNHIMHNLEYRLQRASTPRVGDILSRPKIRLNEPASTSFGSNSPVSVLTGSHITLSVDLKRT